MTDDSRGEELQETIPETTEAAPAPAVAPEAAAAPAAPAYAPVAAAPAAPAYAPVAAAPLQPAAGGAVPPAKKGLGTGAILGIVGGGLVVLIALIVAVVVAISVVRGVSAGGGSGGSGGAAGGSPEATAEAYLTAVADGDAETALSYLDETVTSGPLLTDEALAAAQELAPLTDIVIGEPDVTSGSGSVPVTYTIGDTPISTEISVYQISDGWKISAGTGQLGVYQLDGLEPTINGIPVSGEFVDAFPGAYEYGVTVDGFALEGETVVVLTTSEFADTSGMTAVLTPEAADAFRQAVSASIDACVASKTLEAGCGLTIPATLTDGTVLTDGTITRTISAETRAEIGAFVPEVSYDVPTLVTGGYLGSVEVTAECTKDGSTGTCSLLFGPSLGTPSMNFATEGAVIEWD